MFEDERMKIIIAGDGKVGQTLARLLSDEGYDLTLVDTKQSVLETSQEQYDVMVVHGNCATMDILKQAGVGEADLLIAATGEDEINLLCCMTAHFMNENLHTIARIRNPEYADQIYAMRRNFALSMMINPEKQAAEEIERMLKYPVSLKRETFQRGRMEIIELKIDARSKLKNITLTDLNSVVKCKVLVCSVIRDGEMIAPAGDFVLQEGDCIYVTAPTDNLTHLLKNLDIITHKIKNVMLCGGGRVSYYLASRLLNTGIKVHIIEKDEKRCEELAKILPKADIIFGDATDRDLLDGEGLVNCDALVTLTGMDEVNMVVSMYGYNCGVNQVITKLSHEGNSTLLDSLSLGGLICPKDLCSNTIVQYVHALDHQTGTALAVHSFAGGKADAMEFMVNDQTRFCHTPLRDIRIKKNTLLVGIKHGPLTEIPNGDSMYEKGDILLVVSGADEIERLNDIFE